MKEPEATVKGQLDAILNVVSEIGQQNAAIKDVMKDSAKEMSESLSTILEIVRMSLKEINLPRSK